MNETKPERAVLDTVGLVAGRGEFPLQFCRSARSAGVRRLAVVAMHGETPPEIADFADHVDWVHVGQIRRSIRYLRAQAVAGVVFAGQIRPSRLFGGMRPDWTALRLLWKLQERNAETIFSAVAAEFERCGLHVLPSTTYMESCLAQVGVIGRVKPRRAQLADIEFGLRIAREVSRLDIGQTVVVKRGTVLAVEAFEGTDRAIARGGDVGHGGVTVVKVAKPNHDVRFDVPCIGLRTVESLEHAGAKALAVHAGQTLFLRKAEVIAACDAARIAVVGFDLQD